MIFSEVPDGKDSSSAERRLEALLATSPDVFEAPSPEASEICRGPLILYGAGTLGRTVLTGLRGEGLEPAAFAVDAPFKQSTEVDGVPLMAPSAAAEKFGESAVFVVTILGSRLSFLEARRRLQDQGCMRVVSFLQMARTCARGLLPHYNYDLPRNLLASAPDIRRAFHAWSDEESRRQFTAHIEFRLRADYAALPPASGDIYFPADVPLPLNGETTFVDCGAYDGDTIGKFLDVSGGRFREIYAFEPDSANYAKLRDFVAGLDAASGNRVHIFNAAVASRRARLSFNATGDMGASFGGEGGTEVEAVPLYEVIPAEPGDRIYIKYDVEGAEMEALKGTEPLIARSRPALAVSAYHCPTDLWDLPLYIASLDARYQLYLRTQGSDGMDVICYAVPQYRA